MQTQNALQKTRTALRAFGFAAFLAGSLTTIGCASTPSREPSSAEDRAHHKKVEQMIDRHDARQTQVRP